jgi:hypothetical protein
MPADSTKRLSLSVFQLMKLVVIFTVAFASVARTDHIDEGLAGTRAFRLSNP